VVYFSGDIGGNLTIVDKFVHDRARFL